jgi:hypothetical protein
VCGLSDNSSRDLVSVTRAPMAASPLSLDALRYWKRRNQSLWGEGYWPRKIRDDQHYTIAMRSRGWFDAVDLPYVGKSAKPAFKLLYDSYFWKMMLAQLDTPSAHGSVLELLPGKTFTLPVALESIGFCGCLHRLDLSPQPAGLGQFSFSCCCINEDLFRFPFDQPTYDLVIANHVIDDLLMYIYFRGQYCQTKAYSDRRESRLAWEEIACLDPKGGFTAQLSDFLERLILRLPSGAMFISREYPSTFELRVGDIARISYLESVRQTVLSHISRLPGVTGGYVHLAASSIPIGESYPNSTFVLKK